jgi:hypothetical protein
MEVVGEEAREGKTRRAKELDRRDWTEGEGTGLGEYGSKTGWRIQPGKGEGKVLY